MGSKRWGLVVGLWCLGIPAAGLAAPKASPPAEAEPGVEPVAQDEIREESARAKARLDAIGSRTEGGPSLSVVETELPQIVDRVAELEAEPALDKVERLSDRELEDLAFSWQQVARRIAALEKRIGNEADRFTEELSRAQAILDRWEVTEQLDEMTPTAKGRVLEVHRAAKKVEADLRHDLQTIHNAQKQLAGPSATVTQQLAVFATARETHRSRVLTRQEPLWRVDPREGESPLGLIVQTGRRQLEQVRMSLEAGVGSLMVWLAVWLVVWRVLVALGRLPLDDGEGITRGLRSSLRRPRSAGWVLAVGAFALLGPPIPWGLRQALWLTTLPALLRLLAPTPYRSIALAFIAPLTLSLLGEVVPASSEWARYVHLLVSVTGLLAAVWIGRLQRSVSFEGLGRRTVRATEALLAVSVVANVVGYGALAPVINHATMFGIFWGVLIIAVVGVCQALIRMSVRTELLRRSRAVRNRGDAIANALLRFVVWGAWIVWVAAAAEGFGVAEPVWTWLMLWMEEPWEIGAFSIAPGDLIAFSVALYAAVLVSRLLRFVLDEDVLPRLGLARGLPATISMLVRYAVLALGFTVAVVAAGFDLDKVSLLVGALGVGIGFGLQNVVNNFVSGLILMFERPINVGDTVEVGSLIGQVTHVGIRASTLRTYQGAEVIVPNANLTSNEVINWTLSDRRRRVDVRVGVAYGTDPERVLALLRRQAEAHPAVLRDPDPITLFDGFGDSSLDFLLFVWTADFDAWRVVQSQLGVAINRALAEEGIEIPFPQRDLHLRSVDGEVLDRAGRVAAAPAAAARMREPGASEANGASEASEANGASEASEVDGKGETEDAIEPPT